MDGQSAAIGRAAAIVMLGAVVAARGGGSDNCARNLADTRASD
ncbi:MAG: hypothetical protein U5L03_09365 [Burkholderiaceae bacterium]|nr:hypothetical protein [Burkholderiaceae bacterium]